MAVKWCVVIVVEFWNVIWIFILCLFLIMWGFIWVFLTVIFYFAIIHFSFDSEISNENELDVIPKCTECI